MQQPRSGSIIFSTSFLLLGSSTHASQTVRRIQVSVRCEKSQQSMRLISTVMSLMLSGSELTNVQMNPFQSIVD